jgi:hypothetical protein
MEEERESDMFLIKKRTLCVSLFLCAFLGTQPAIANNLMHIDTNNITQRASGNVIHSTKSPMTLVSTEFSFNSLEEAEGRLLIRGRKGLRSRRVQY